MLPGFRCQPFRTLWNFFPCEPWRIGQHKNTARVVFETCPMPSSSSCQYAQQFFYYHCICLPVWYFAWISLPVLLPAGDLVCLPTVRRDTRVKLTTDHFYIFCSHAADIALFWPKYTLSKVTYVCLHIWPLVATSLTHLLKQEQEVKLFHVTVWHISTEPLVDPFLL